MRDIYASEIGILTALHTIQVECKSHGDSGECGVRYCGPENWEINDDMKWRAFK